MRCLSRELCRFTSLIETITGGIIPDENGSGNHPARGEYWIPKISNPNFLILEWYLSPLRQG